MGVYFWSQWAILILLMTVCYFIHFKMLLAYLTNFVTTFPSPTSEDVVNNIRAFLILIFQKRKWIQCNDRIAINPYCDVFLEFRQLFLWKKPKLHTWCKFKKLKNAIRSICINVYFGREDLFGVWPSQSSIDDEILPGSDRLSSTSGPGFWLIQTS